MNLWRNIPDRLTEGLSAWRLWAMALLSVALTVSVAGGYRISEKLLLIGKPAEFALYAIGFGMAASLRSGQKQLHLAPGHPKSQWAAGYKLFYGPALWGAGVVASLALTALAGLLLYIFPDPQHLKDVPADALWMQIFSCFMAGAEEIWKMGMVVIGLWGFRKAFPRLWDRESAKWAAAGGAAVAAACVFGWMHTFAYEERVWFSLPIFVTLSAAGLAYTAVALATRRLWMAVVFHIAFDLMSVWMRRAEAASGSEASIENGLTLALVATLIVLPGYHVCYKKMENWLNIRRSEKSAD